MIDWLWLIGSLSLVGSILALSVLLIRSMAKRFLSGRLQYILWLLVLFRLLVPIPTVRVDRAISVQPLQTVGNSAPVYSDSLPGTEQAANELIIAPIAQSGISTTSQRPVTLQQTWNTLKERFNRVLQNAVQVQTEAAAFIKILELPLFFIWICGVLLILTLDFRRYHRLMQLIRSRSSSVTESEQQMMEKCSQELGIRQSVRLLRSATIPSPLLTGLWRPIIYLPDQSLSNAEMRLVFYHELTHLKSCDLISKLLIQVACAIHWFNPFLLIIQRQLTMACEIACDETVSRRLNLSERRQYGELLIRQAEMPKHQSLSGAQALSAHGRQLRQRLQAVLNGYQPSRKNWTASVIIVVILVMVMLSIGIYSWPLRSKIQRYSVDTFNFYQTDWQGLVDQFGLSTYARVDRLRLEFLADGQITEFTLEAYDRAGIDDVNLKRHVQVSYDPKIREILVNSKASEPIYLPGEATDRRLVNKSTLSRLNLMLDRPDWATQLKKLDYPYFGMAYEGDESLGTKVDETFLVNMDGSFIVPNGSDTPIATGTLLYVFGTHSEQGPSEVVNYYCLPIHSSSLSVNGNASNGSVNVSSQIPDKLQTVTSETWTNGQLVYRESITDVYRLRVIRDAVMVYILDSSGQSSISPDQMKNYIRFHLEATNSTITDDFFYVFFQDGEYHIQDGLTGLHKKINTTVYEPFVSLLLGGFGFNHELEHRLRPNTDGVSSFLKQAQDIGFTQLPQGFADDTCYNVTPLEVNYETSCQIYKFAQSAAAYLSVEDKIYQLGQGFGGYGLTDLQTCDFDHDGQLDLVYTYSAGSGLHRSNIAVFSLKTKQETVLEYSLMSDDLFLGKIADDQFAVYSAEVKIQNNNFADLVLTRKDLLSQIVDKDGFPAITK